MTTHEFTLFDASLRRRGARAGLALALMAGSAVAGATVVLDPFRAGQFAAGSGANATFFTVDGTRKDTLMYWNEDLRQASSTPLSGYTAIRDTSWGTGIWGLADWNNINRSATPDFRTTGPSSLIASTISFGDSHWAGCVADPASCRWAPDTWKAAAASLPTAEQDNWTSHFTGYIRVTDEDDYNFRVLFDDGFFLKIWGAESAFVSPFEIASDFLSPRTYMSFTEGFRLRAGLYKFELGAYDRLEAGVVQLEWMRAGQWAVIPTDNLVAAIPEEGSSIPTPGSFPLLIAAGGAFLVAGAKRKRG